MTYGLSHFEPIFLRNAAIVLRHWRQDALKRQEDAKAAFQNQPPRFTMYPLVI